MHDLRNNNTRFTHTLRYVEERQDNPLLTLFYRPFGKIFLKIATSRFVTEKMGAFYDSKFSKRMIPKFIEQNGIDMKLYKEVEYHSFNEFFTREKKKIKFPKQKNLFCSPCDGYLSAYEIEKNRTFRIKGIDYTLEELLRNHSLVKLFEGGMMYIFRLTPKNYHRYHYFDSGKFLMKKEIPGIFHTVRSVALERVQVFLENERVWSLLSTENFGDIIYMEVGALGVGKIKNHDKKSFQRGEEKGSFQFGGSTVIVLFQKDILKKDEKLLKNSKENLEAVVECGWVIGEKE